MDLVFWITLPLIALFLYAGQEYLFRIANALEARNRKDGIK